jgi:hypothetical protein
MILVGSHLESGGMEWNVWGKFVSVDEPPSPYSSARSISSSSRSHSKRSRLAFFAFCSFCSHRFGSIGDSRLPRSGSSMSQPTTTSVSSSFEMHSLFVHPIVFCGSACRERTEMDPIVPQSSSDPVRFRQSARNDHCPLVASRHVDDSSVEHKFEFGVWKVRCNDSFLGSHGVVQVFKVPQRHSMCGRSLLPFV